MNKVSSLVLQYLKRKIQILFLLYFLIVNKTEMLVYNTKTSHTMANKTSAVCIKHIIIIINKARWKYRFMSMPI